MKDEELYLEKQLCHRLYMASNALTRAYKPILDELNLSYPQFVVMMALWEQDNIVMSALSEKTCIDTGSLTLIAKKLVTKQLVAFAADDEDKRRKFIRLTEIGQQLQKTAMTVPEKIHCAFPNMQADELQQLFSLLDKLNNDLRK